MRKSTTQVIEDGTYLDPLFDPRTLTVSQLNGLLMFHEVDFPSNLRKSALLVVYDNHIGSHLEELKEERRKRDRVAPSCEGIVVIPALRRPTKVCLPLAVLTSSTHYTSL
jgi:hypothetical protein